MSAMTSDTGASETTAHDPPLAVLDIVRDREDDNATDAVVVNTPPVPASDWVIHAYDGVVTVADDNPGYDPEAEVVVVAFRDELEETRPEFTDTTDALTLADAGDVATYAFPPRRLRRVATICPGDTEEDNDASGRGGNAGDGTRHAGAADNSEEPDETLPLGPDMAALRDRLDDSGEVWAEERAGRAVLVVPKLGEEHTIRPDGTVSDGPLAGRIRDLAAEYLGGGAE